MEAPQLSRLQRLTYRVWLGVGVLVLGYGVVVLFGPPIAVMVAPLLVALLIVYLLNPAVAWLAEHRIHRLVGTAICYVVGLGLLVGGVALVVPSLTSQLAAFATAAPDLGNQLVDGVNAFMARLGLGWRLGPMDSGLFTTQIQAFVEDEENRGALMALWGGLMGIASGLFTVALAILVGPVIAFYLLADLPRIGRFAYAAVPPTYRAEVVSVGQELSRVVGGFVRGQLLIAVIVGTAMSIGLALIGLDYWLVVGIIGGVTNLVPLIGPIFGGLVGIVLALLTDGVTLALLVLAVVTAVQQLDNQILSPIIMGRTTKVHPLLVLLALLVAGTLYGIFGMIVAVPLVAGAKVLVLHLWATRVPWAAPVPTESAPSPPDADATVPGARDEPLPHAELASDQVDAAATVRTRGSSRDGVDDPGLAGTSSAGPP